MRKDKILPGEERNSDPATAGLNGGRRLSRKNAEKENFVNSQSRKG
jgi:hypothetical protein